MAGSRARAGSRTAGTRTPGRSCSSGSSDDSRRLDAESSDVASHACRSLSSAASVPRSPQRR
eukprot:9487971-Pyramimonas_sp.AAC.1